MNPTVLQPVASSAFFLLFLVPLVPAGFALMNTGLGRSRSAAHFMLSSLCTAALAACVFALWGGSLAGIGAGIGAGTGATHEHVLILRGHGWDWIATGRLLWPGAEPTSSRSTLFLLLQIFTVGIAAMIPLATGADRWRLSACLASTALLAGWTYPLLAHWVWGGGWLSQLGANYGMGRGFLDPAGAATIHVLGGLTALSIAWILGPRFGKYSAGDLPAAIPGYSIVAVLFGCAVMLPGWIALNAMGAILFANSTPGEMPLIAVNTFLSASASCLATLATTAARFSKPDASLCANGWVAGLVTSSALCAYVTPGVAIFTGFAAGVLITFAIEFVETRLGIDDPGGAISVHGLAGIWGLLAAGIFTHIPQFALTPNFIPRLGPAGAIANGGIPQRGQFMAQLVGVATLLGLILPLSYGLNWVLNRIHPQRVDQQGERLGMDLRELGGGAYPEFVVRNDEFAPR